MTIPIRNIYYLLLYAWDCLDELDDAAVGDDAGASWVDLAGRVLVAWHGRQRRRGLALGYSERIQTMSGVRGRLLVAPTARRSLLQQGKAVCRFQEVSTDTPVNRVVKAALSDVARSSAATRATRDLARDVVRQLAAVTDLPLTEALCVQVQTHSNVRAYRLPLSIALLLAQNRFPDERPDGVRFRAFDSDDGPMPLLFEAFVLNFLKREQRVFKARRRILQWPVSNLSPGASAMLPVMRTDVSLERADQHVVVETKYYARPLVSYRGGNRLRSGHLYQLAAYLRATPADETAQRPPAGVLLYAQPRGAGLDLQFTLRDNPIRVTSIDLGQDWQDIHRALLALVAWAESGSARLGEPPR